jgi:hypothetical protein
MLCIRKQIQDSTLSDSWSNYKSMLRSWNCSTVQFYNLFCLFLSYAGLAIAVLNAKWNFTRVIKTCSRLGIQNASSLEKIYKKSVIQRCNIITADCQHPLHNQYVILPSGRRFRSLKCRTSRYLKSFVPSSIRILNDHS